MKMYRFSFVLLSVCVIGLLVLNVDSQTLKGCPNNWETYVSNQAITCLWMSSDKASWIDAMSWCQVMGGHLVELGSDAFNRKISGMIRMRLTGKYWIGLTDMESETEYKWMSSKRRPPALFFKSGQLMSGRQKNCVVTDETGLWTVESCKAEFFFICQK